MASGHQTAIITVALTATTFILVGIRCLCRFHLTKNYGIDDILIICALICSIGFTMMINMEVLHGLGNPLIYEDTKEFIIVMKFFYASVPFYYLGLSLAKVSILLQYLRFFPQGRSRKCCWYMIIFSVGFGVIAVIWGFFICLPVPYVWDRSIKGGTCRGVKLAYVSAGLAILSDIVICVLPIPLLKDLRISPFQKYALIGVFVVGGMTFIATAIRIPSVIALLDSPVFGANDNDGLLWSSIELNMGMIAACLPTLKPLASLIIPRSVRPWATSKSHVSKPQELKSVSKPSQSQESVHGLTREDIESSDTVLQWPSISQDTLGGTSIVQHDASDVDHHAVSGEVTNHVNC